MVVVEFLIRLVMAIFGFYLIVGLTSKEPTALKALISNDAMMANVLLVIGISLILFASASDWYCDKVKAREAKDVDTKEAEAKGL